jgi:Flp pilus assembly protein TadD
LGPVSQPFDLGMHHFLREEWRQAAQEFQLALREAPKDGRTWSLLGMTLAHLGRAPDAEAALSRAIALQPQDGESWFHLGIARSMRNEWAPAASALRRAVALMPGDLVAWHRLGVALAESGDRSSATVAFERALVLSRETGGPAPETPAMEPSPEAPDPHLSEGGARESAGEADSWLALALSLLSLGDEEEAMAAYERAFSIDPDRAQRSLFRPMLRLLTLAAGEPVDDEPPVREPAPESPRPRPIFGTPTASRRPEVG